MVTHAKANLLAQFLLGKPIEIKPEESDVKKIADLPGSNFLQQTGQNNLSSSANEEFNKMNNDPLVMMRAKEQEARAGEGPRQGEGPKSPGGGPSITRDRPEIRRSSGFSTTRSR